MAFDAKGDIKQIDYVVYKWDAKGNYTEINPEGLLTPSRQITNIKRPGFAGAFLFWVPDNFAAMGTNWVPAELSNWAEFHVIDFSSINR